MSEDRRKITDRDKEVIADIVRAELVDRWSLKKNGHSWVEWLEKVFTPERILMLIVLGFTVSYSAGGKVRDILVELDQAARLAKVASDKADLAATKAEAAAQTNDDLQMEILNLQQQVAIAQKTQDSFRNDVRSKLAVIVTRQEFNTAMKTVIEPRIEKK